MDLTEAFRNKIKEKINPEFYWKLYEDYSFVVSYAEELGFKTGTADVWCANCEEEFEEVDFNIYTLEWKCPKCKKIDNQ